MKRTIAINIERNFYFYKIMPFMLKNARVTYSHLVNKVFMNQIRRNMEVCIDDICVKRMKVDHHIANLEKLLMN